MAKYMLKHEGKLERWCPVQADVDEYFRTTLEQVSVISNPGFFGVFQAIACAALICYAS